MLLEDDSWQLVQSTPRVSGFVGGTKDRPLPISEDDVNNIINRIEVGEDAPAPKTIYELINSFWCRSIFSNFYPIYYVVHIIFRYRKWSIFSSTNKT